MKREIVILIILFQNISWSQSDEKYFLSLTSPDFKRAHIISESKLVKVWVNDSTHYTGFLTILDSQSISVRDTIINTSDIFQIKARNKRRSYGALFTILSPPAAGAALEVVLLLTNVLHWTDIGLVTGAGIVGGFVGAINVLFFMNRKLYKMEDDITVKIESADS